MSTKINPKIGKKSKRVYNECANAIKRTLAYRAVFSYPLSFFQLSTLLISDKIFDAKSIKRELTKLVEGGEVYITRGKFYLRGFKRPVDWSERNGCAKDFLQSAKPAIDLLKKIPWIQLIGITGSVAAFNSKEGDDIDVFIVTKKNRLWITRLLVVLILKVANLYRTPESYAKKICPNLFITENEMAWQKKDQNIYIAHEILLLIPVFYRDNAYFSFIEANNWVFSYFPQCTQNFVKSRKRISKTQINILDYLESILMGLQKIYMHRKRTNEVVNTTKIHFNKSDNKATVTENYKKTLDRLALTLIE